jgi:hypothetical protein
MVSFRPHHYAAIITYIALCWAVLAAVALAMGGMLGIRVFWLVPDGIACLGFCTVVLSLQWKMRTASKRR